MYIERMNTLAEDFLIRNDKLGMAHGLEGFLFCVMTLEIILQVLTHSF